MRVLFVGTLPPPGDANAYRFGRAAALRAMAGDDVEVHSPHPLSVAHRNLRLGPRVLPRHLRAQAASFQAVVLRVERNFPLARVGGVRRAWSDRALANALGRYGEVTLFLDPISPGEFARAADRVWSAAHRIVVSSEDDRDALLACTSVAPEVVTIERSRPPTSRTIEAWPEVGGSALQSVIASSVRRRALPEGRLPLLLASARGTARPSLSGSSVWLLRRVIGKTRGALTRLLRP